MNLEVAADTAWQSEPKVHMHVEVEELKVLYRQQQPHQQRHQQQRQAGVQASLLVEAYLQIRMCETCLQEVVCLCYHKVLRSYKCHKLKHLNFSKPTSYEPLLVEVPQDVLEER